MKKLSLSLPRLFYNQFFWQSILSVFMIGMAIFFISHEHVEIYDIKKSFTTLNIPYFLLGIIVTILYILLQGEMYVQSFGSLNKTVTLQQSIILYLKRNLVSIFLPAGGFASLGFFSKNLESRGIKKSQVHIASSIYGICSLLSVIVVAIPVLYYALLKGQLNRAELLGFIFLLFLNVVLFAALISLSRRGWVYRFMNNKFPQWMIIIDDISSQKISKKHFLRTLSISVIIEIVGIAHLYIAMLALNLDASIAAAFIGYIVMVILLIASPFLRGLGAIEISITYLLKQYGFSLSQAASVTLLFRIFEFWLPLFSGVASFFSKKDNIILRIFPAIFIFLLGIVNVISAITPAIPSRLKLIEDFLPIELINASNGFVLLSGVLLILIAVFLLQGSKRAWFLALALTSLSVFGHLSKAIDFEEAIFAIVTLIILIYTHASYKLKPHPKLTRLSLRVIIIGLVAVLLYGVLGFYFVDKRHFGQEFELTESIKTVFKLFFLFDNSGIHTQTSFGKNFIYSFYGAGTAYILFVIYGFLRPYFDKPYNSEEDTLLVTKLVEKYGNSALDYFKIYPDKFFFITENKQAFISFKISRFMAIVLENPVARNDEDLKQAIIEFDKYCEENGFIAIYYRVPIESLPIYSSLNKKYFPIGEEAIIDLTTFKMDGKKMQPTRSAINRLTNEGYTFKVYKPPIKEGILQKLELVSNQWLKDMGQKEITFTQGVFDPDILKTHTIFTIEDTEEKIYAFLNLVPVYTPGIVTYDLIRKISNAPNGVMDMLLCKTFLYLQEKAYEKVNLGLAPMSGIDDVSLKGRTIKYAYENIPTFAHFKGLRKFKEKFFPYWEKKYLIYNNDYHLLQVPTALKKVSEL